MAVFGSESRGTNRLDEQGPEIALRRGLLGEGDPDVRKRVKQMIAGALSRSERMLVSLHYADRMSFKEIAAILEEPEEQVAAAHSTVMALLKMLLAREDIGYDAKSLGRLLEVIRGREGRSLKLRLASALRDARPGNEREEMAVEMAQLGMGRVFRDMGLCGGDVALYLIASPLRRIADGEIERQLEDAESVFAKLARKMQEMEKVYQLPDGVFWTLAESPGEYRKLHEEWEAQAAAVTAGVLRSHGEFQLAHLYLNEREEFERRYEAGRGRCEGADGVWLRKYVMACCGSEVVGKTAVG